MRDKIFFSYSHNDKKWLQDIQKLLAPALKSSSIASWSDANIKPGMKWRDEIEKAIAGARVAVLLVTPDFLASEFVANNELPNILHDAEIGGVTVIWIYVKPALYHYTDIVDFQAAHDVSKPLSLMRAGQRQTILIQVVEEILKAFKKSSP